jgi:hypothetical protein
VEVAIFGIICIVLMKVELLLTHLSSDEQVENDQDGSVLDSILSAFFVQHRPVTPITTTTIPLGGGAESKDTSTMHQLVWNNTTEWTKQHIARYVPIRDRHCEPMVKVLRATQLDWLFDVSIAHYPSVINNGWIALHTSTICPFYYSFARDGKDPYSGNKWASSAISTSGKNVNALAPSTDRTVPVT